MLKYSHKRTKQPDENAFKPIVPTSVALIATTAYGLFYFEIAKLPPNLAFMDFGKDGEYGIELLVSGIATLMLPTIGFFIGLRGSVEIAAAGDADDMATAARN